MFVRFLRCVFDLVRQWRHQFYTYGIKVKGYFLDDDDEAKVLSPEVSSSKYPDYIRLF